MPAMVAGPRRSQREAAGGEQGKGYEQAADEFHRGSPPVEGRGRNGAAIDPVSMDRKKLRLNATQSRHAGFRQHSVQ
jgi:hypothetical protein